MKVLELLNGVEILSSKVNMNENISFPCSDSRRVIEGGLFVAIKGKNRDGNDYITVALASGAKCIITDSKEAYLENYNTVLVKNSRLALAHIWNNYYKKPTLEMKIIAITGTNGKTSCAYYLYNILKNANKKIGLISTIECLINGNTYDTNGGSDVADISSAMTTPDPEVLYSIFNKMKENGVEYVVMEASSHALELFKLEPIALEIGIFTNLSSEHLDFHGSMEKYFKAKTKLFQNCKYGIVNIDDKYGERLLKSGISEFVSCSRVKKADFWVTCEMLSIDGCEYILNTNETLIRIRGKICGEFSVYNTMLAFACAFKLGIDKNIIVNGILNTETIPGRMEMVEKNVYIDYAHTPHAMKCILTSLKKTMPQKRIIALFGCGGDRDSKKRPEMGKIASQEADTIVITSDNCRSESPVDIFRDILKGLNDDADFVLIPNREDAIKYSINLMTENDVFILLGKGHESYEIDKKGKHCFSEREIIKGIFRNDKN